MTPADGRPADEERGRDTLRIALISCPWPILRRPSIQLGTLKAYLAKYHPRHRTDTVHLYLEVGRELGAERYSAVAGNGWLSECIYAALLFPERIESVARFFSRQRKERRVELPPLGVLVEGARRATEGVLGDIAKSGYCLCGFTLSLAQWTSSLYCVRRLKALHPSVQVVVGGSHCAGELGRSLLENVAEIDYVVSGEGERPLSALVSYLSGDLPDPGPNVWYRKEGRVCGYVEPSASQVHLDRLPLPDFDEYFRRLQEIPVFQGMVAHLPVEASRGCWWQAVCSVRGREGCRFCNLNLQWHGFRAKRPLRLWKEVEALTRRYPALDLFFTDNSLPLRPIRFLARKERHSTVDRRYFGELRAPLSRADARILKKGGFRQVQVGVEALSTSLLGRMNKGITALDNFCTMKYLEEAGIQSDSNLILGFPGSTMEEVEETLRAIRLASCFAPLKPVFFWLGFGSPVYASAGEYGLSAVRNHTHYHFLLPPDWVRRFRLIGQTYRGDRSLQRRRWAPVLKAIRQWEQEYRRTRIRYPNEPVLGYRDGGRFLWVRRRSPEGAPVLHRLEGISAEVYRYCGTPKSVEAVCRRFPALDPPSVTRFWEELVEKGLGFREKNRFLSLAVPDP